MICNDTQAKMRPQAEQFKQASAKTTASIIAYHAVASQAEPPKQASAKTTALACKGLLRHASTKGCFEMQ